MPDVVENLSTGGSVRWEREPSNAQNYCWIQLGLWEESVEIDKALRRTGRVGPV